MNIVAILGSPHGKNGNTAKLLAEMTQAAERAGAAVTTLLLSEYSVQPCGACDACHKTGVCPIKDDFKLVRARMEQADGIILASPNYIFSVSAQLKALLDRCCGPIHLQNMTGKYGAAVVTSGGEGAEEVEAYLLRVLQSLGCWTVGSAGANAAQLYDEQARAAVLKAAAALGANLVNAIRTREIFAEQVPARQAFFERMKYIVSMNRDSWKYEYRFWSEQGRL